MKRITISVFSSVFLFLIAVTSSAGTIDLAQTGMSACYDETGGGRSCAGTGEDADIAAGLIWPGTRFTDNGDGTVTDNLTGLMWLKDANCANTISHDPDGTGNGSMQWQNALDFVAGINSSTHDISGCSSYTASYADWRLPNLNEFLSIRDYSQNGPPLPSGHPFQNVATQYYYTSTTHALTDYAYAVRMMTAQTSLGDKDANSMYVWPVRDSGTAGEVSLFRTGQTGCYADDGSSRSCSGTGEDGELQKGAAWPGSRFADNGDGTVTDNLTGLIWLQKDIDCFGAKGTWQEALDAVDDLNADPASFHALVNCPYTGTYDDWRLPNMRELISITDATYYERDCGGACLNIAQWLNQSTNHFSIEAYTHWSSTTAIHNPANAWSVDLSTSAAIQNYDKDGSDYSIWAVRGGIYGDPDISVSADPLDFGNVAVGTTKEGILTVTNEGTYYLEMGSATAPGDPFSLMIDGCDGDTLGPDESCQIKFGYSPAAEGASADTFDLNSDDPDENPLTVNLSGTGTVDTGDGDGDDGDGDGSGDGADGVGDANTPPEASSLVYPADGATGLGTTVTFIWGMSSDTDGDDISYDLTVCKSEDFVGCTAMENVAYSHEPSLTDQAVLFARKWVVPIIVAPFSLAGCGGSTNATVGSPDTTPTAGEGELSYTMAGLDTSTTYFWKVTANDAEGATESDIFSFTTE